MENYILINKDVFLFDVKDFSSLENKDQVYLSANLLNQVNTFFFPLESLDKQKNGDGYYVYLISGEDHKKKNFFSIINFIQHFIMNEIQMRYFIDNGEIAISNILDNGVYEKIINGDVINNASHFLTSIRAGNVAFCSKNYFENLTGQKIENEGSVIITYFDNAVSIDYETVNVTDKNNKIHSVINFTFNLKSVEYCENYLEILEQEEESNKYKDFVIEPIHLERILNAAYPNKKVQELNSHNQFQVLSTHKTDQTQHFYKRLAKVATELNQSKDTVLDFLKSKGYQVENNPNAKLSEEQYFILVREFQVDKKYKQLAEEELILRRQKYFENLESEKTEIVYWGVKLNETYWEVYLFINPNSNQKKTLEYFTKNYKVPTQTDRLNVLVNRKYLDSEKSTQWQKRFDKKVKIFFPVSKVQYIDDYIWEYCIPKELKVINNIDVDENYVSPKYKVKDIEKKILIENYLQDWVTEENSALIVIKGNPGIGKTTLLKLATSKLRSRYQNKLVLFMEIEKLAEYFNLLNYDLTLTSLSELILYYFNVRNIDNNFSTNISIKKDELDIYISSGNFIIIIDGIDEISTKFGETFVLKKFMENVLSIIKYFKNGKIIISTRNFYWDAQRSKLSESIIIELLEIDLLGFDIKAAERYFKLQFAYNEDEENVSLKEETQSKVRQALNKLTKLKTEEEGYYNPNIAFLVSEIISSKQAIKIHDFTSKLLIKGFDFDSIFYEHIYSREITRQRIRLEVDKILSIYKFILIEYNGSVKLEDIKAFIQILIEEHNRALEPQRTRASRDISIDIEDNYNKYINNPFIKVSGDIVSLKSGFIEEYLARIFLANDILNNEVSLEFLISTNKFYSKSNFNDKNYFLARIIDRLLHSGCKKDIFIAYFNNLLLNYVEPNISKVEYKLICKKVVFISLEIAFKLFDSEISGKRQKMNLIKELYNYDEKGVIRNLHIFGKEFPELDFSNVIIQNSSFIDYKNFPRCIFNENTKFNDNCEINEIDSSITNLALSPNLFDDTCILPSNFKKGEGSKADKLNRLKKDIKEILKKFKSHNGFRSRTKEQIILGKPESEINQLHIIDALKLKYILVKSMEPAMDWKIADNKKACVSQLLDNYFADKNIEDIMEILLNNYENN